MHSISGMCILNERPLTDKCLIIINWGGRIEPPPSPTHLLDRLIRPLECQNENCFRDWGCARERTRKYNNTIWKTDCGEKDPYRKILTFPIIVTTPLVSGTRWLQFVETQRRKSKWIVIGLLLPWMANSIIMAYLINSKGCQKNKLAGYNNSTTTNIRHSSHL